MNNYQYIISNNNSLSSDAETWNTSSYDSLWLVQLVITVHDWNLRTEKYTLNYWLYDENPTPGIEYFENSPEKFSIGLNYPNPFNATTQIPYNLPEAGYIKILIYDIQGRLVKKLKNAYKTAGYHTITWDGQNGQNTTINSGIYFCQMVTANWKETRKIILLR